MFYLWLNPSDIGTVKLILRTEKANAKGEAPLYIRITKDRKSTYTALQIYLHPSQWDDEEKRVRKNHPNSARLNKKISQKKAEAEGVVLDLEEQSASVPSKRIKDALKGKKSPSFLDYADNYNLGLKKNGQISTYTKRKAIFVKLRVYLNDQDLTFDEITVSFLKGYERHLRDELGNSTNTIYFNLKVLRRVINEAIDEDLMDHAKNPFLRYKLKLEKTDKEYLTEEQLTQLEALALTPGTKVYHHRNMYVFSAYTGGLRISDVLLLKWKHIEDGKVIITTKKTGTIVSIKVPSKALAILDLYRPEKANKEALVFPVLKPDLNLQDPQILYQALSSATAYANKNLKTLATKLELSHNMNFHSSRHTWAARALRKGMPLPYVSSLMGHTSIKTTQIYAKVISEELDKAMEVFD